MINQEMSKLKLWKVTCKDHERIAIAKDENDAILDCCYHLRLHLLLSSDCIPSYDDFVKDAQATPLIVDSSNQLRQILTQYIKQRAYMISHLNNVIALLFEMITGEHDTEKLNEEWQ